MQGNEAHEIRPATTAWSEFLALLALVTLAGGAMAWLVSTFRIDRTKVDALRSAAQEEA